MRRLLPLLLFTLAGGAPLLAAAHPVLLISIDGLRPDDVLDARERGLALPSLTALVTNGSHARGVVGVMPTLTYPSHVTLLTGVTPAVHGVTGNLTFDPYNTNQYGWDWYASDIKVPTLWDAAHAAGLSTANVHWPVSVGAQVDWNLPQIWRTGSLDDRKLLAALATPGLLPALEKTLGPYADGIDEKLDGDRNRARFAERLLTLHAPQFMTVYFAALDHEEHAHGPGSPEADRTLEAIDALVGSLVDVARRVHPDGVVAVVSDHGFAPVAQDVNLYGPFLQAGLVTIKDGAVSDWQAEPWNDGGSAAVVLRDPDDAGVKRRVAALLLKLKADPAYGIGELLDHDAVVRKGGAPNASWFVVFKPGFEMGIKPDAPMLSPGHYEGMHGYDPATTSMQATLLIAGPGIPAGHDLGVVDMRDIAPTLAAQLGVRLSQAQGKVLLEVAP